MLWRKSVKHPYHNNSIHINELTRTLREWGELCQKIPLPNILSEKLETFIVSVEIELDRKELLLSEGIQSC